MIYELIKKENNDVTLNVTVPAADFEKAVNTAYMKERSKFNIQGFRKGKAPRKIIEVQYGSEVFFEEAVNVVLPKAYSSALDELKIDPVDRPTIDVKAIGKGVDLVIEAVVTVKPEVKLGEYKGVEVETVKVEVTDEDVNTEVEKSREMNGRLVNVEDRGIADGDSAIIDYKGFVGEDQFAGGTADNHTLVIGSGSFIPGFEEQLVGAKTGDEVEVNVTFPEEYQSEELAGKEAVFKVDVKGIKVKELPELDDEFAKDTSEFDTLEELKADLKKTLQEAATKNAELAQRDKVIDAAVATMEADIPEVMFEGEVDGMLRDFDQQLRQQGLNLEQYVQFTGASLDDLKSQMRNDAEIRVKTGLALEEIIKLENIEISTEEIEAEMTKISETQNATMEDVRKAFMADDYAYLRDSLSTRKVVDLLVENAKLI